MKKKLIIVCMFLAFGLANAQVSLFKPVPKDLFSNALYKVTANPQEWIWRFDATVIGDEQIYHKDTKQFTSLVLSAVGPAIGYKHFVPTSLTDPTPYCNFGVSAALLLGTDIYNASLSSMKIGLFLNAFQFVKIGGAYTLNVPTNVSHLSIVVGGSVNF
jgi:hypothetical protein